MLHKELIKNNVKDIDWRDVHILEKFINNHGKIVPRKVTGVTAKMQKKIEKSIKRARYMGFLSYVYK